eukprot:m.92409 g.92409  ORF g.92409 m.92409 type:complete len:371 (+) comp13350_c0_seq2:347-1459(+)
MLLLVLLLLATHTGILVSSSAKKSSINLTLKKSLVSKWTLPKNFIFVHVPKCAGSSFLAMARDMTTAANADIAWYPNNESHSWNAPGCLQGKSLKHVTHCGFHDLYGCFHDRKEMRNVSEYLPYNWHRDQDTRFVTVLREPVERVISEFFWWRRTCHHFIGVISNKLKVLTQFLQGDHVEGKYWQDELCKMAQALPDVSPNSIAKWVSSPFNNGANRMTKQFAMHSEKYESSADSCLAFSADRQAEFWPKMYNLDYEEGLEDAINNDTAFVYKTIHTIEMNFDFVAIQEQLQSSLRLLQYHLNIPQNTVYQDEVEKYKIHKKKGNTKNADIAKSDPNLRAVIQRHNRLDVILFEHFSSLFNETIRQVFGV